jgi:drug/metabolite transporter (DMT)-like permease
VPPELSDLTEQITLTPYQSIGVPIALVGAVFLSLGAQLQHQGVTRVEVTHGDGEKAGLSIRQLMHLLARPSWVVGTLLLGLAIVFQLGVVALVMTAILNARISKIKLDRHAIRAIAMCVTGVGIFVAIAAVYAIEREITEVQLLIILGILGLILAAFAVAFGFARHVVGAMFYIIGAGVLFGFVATLAKVVINRILNNNFEWLTVVAIVALLASAALGSYFVQTAYSVGSPDLVIAGLTVIDPLIAVLIGVIVLGEASMIPVGFMITAVVAGSVAILGVWQLAKHHPQTHR